MSEVYLRTFSDIERQDAERRLQLEILTKPVPCRVCRTKVWPADDGTPRTVCKACGGQKKQDELEEQDRREERRRNETAALLRLAGINQERTTMEAKNCSKGCGRTLGPNNRSGICTPCQNGGTEREKKPAPTSDVKKQFRALTAALDVDGDELVERFMQGWIDNLKSRVSVDG